jgi:hypothetical protein
MTRDEKAKALIEAEIGKAWPKIVQSVSVTPRIDFLDEPALDVLVGLNTILDVPSSLAYGDMLAKLDAALQESGDGRSAHIAFSAPDEEVEFEADEEEEVQGFGS